MLKALAAITITLSAFIPVLAQKRVPDLQTQSKITNRIPERSTLININKLSMWIRADGMSGRNPHTFGGGVIFPHGTTNVVFQDGIVWAGLVKDGKTPELRAGGQRHIVGTVEGRIISKGVAEDPNDPDVRIWRIRRDWNTADLRQDAAELNNISIEEVTKSQIAEVREQYERDWNEWPWQKGAPFYDNNNGIMDPGEEPGLFDADQVVWLVANDLSEGHTFEPFGSPPIGIEFQATLWAYKGPPPLDHAIFKHYRVIYKGTATTPDTAHIDSMYIGQWSDPDVGSYSDDFVGVDTLLSLGYGYNASEIDDAYSRFDLPPPAAGYVLFASPTTDLPTRQTMTSFGYSTPHPLFHGCLGYECALEFWNLFRGFMPRSDPKNPEPWRTPSGDITKFPLSGDPVAGTGDIDGIVLSPGDRRMLMSSGPFTMALGDTQNVLIALVAAHGGSHLTSVSMLKFHTRAVFSVFENDLRPPNPPAPPELAISKLDRTLVLNWGNDATAVAETEPSPQDSYEFEGYNVYQLPSQEAPLEQAKKIATFDRVNEVTTIMRTVFHRESGRLLQRPLRIGRNTGVQRFLVVTHDHLRDRPLANGTPYYFAVTAYNHNPDNPIIPSLETPLDIHKAVPEWPKPGVRQGHAVGDTLKVEPLAGAGFIFPIVIDPSQISGDRYRIRIRRVGQDQLMWDLFNETAGEFLLRDQTNFSGNNDYPLIGGLLVKVVGEPPVREFFFGADAPSFDPQTAQRDVRQQVNVYPNPYVGVNRLETSRFRPFVTFTHLPQKTKIQIFNLAGQLVRTLEKDNDSQFLKWDLTNDHNWLVASGIYLARIEMPELDEVKVLKVVIVNRQLY
ncbi:T9SS type A sorting domain-containing protein [candidate division KSB1 bacterium]|nr:T9SS type A sorting domain-containing protein [candidate division KSB1 bacterium]NIR71592.1 T9SS type A sorting domain-containing protein [candidate division KSB1 bacterium]NIS23546.1 T9SS type A sorting domain-containing protein [candidate division KSB1 bacterium]NIT70469.1 T9SS type A sorting domain-containing protein [candidate division KSB1 bacterium]NIU24180.1 T9SS type A sorting domain-containing protein [candidate division KSB1 bacterium]